MKQINGFSFNQIVSGLLILPVLATGAPAQEHPESAATASGLVEVVPTSQHHHTSWRYTLQRPGADWQRREFDDRTWKIGAGGFGTLGTPGIVIRTRWDTDDIWLRREVTLPTDAAVSGDLQLLMFHDEDVEVYFDGVLAAQQSGFVREYEPTEIRPEARKLLKSGAKLLIAVHCHQTSGGQGIDLGLVQVPAAFAEARAAARRKRQYTDFAMSHNGDADLGRKLFTNDQRLACTRCHTLDGKGDKAGPDLSTIGDKFSRRELIEAVLSPSANIAIGYTTTIIRTKGGDTFEGIVKDTAGDQIELMGADGKLVRIRTADVERQRTSNVSLMPEGLEAGITPQEFTDLTDFLASLRLPASAQVARQGMPVTIPQLATPAELVPINSDEHRFTHPCWLGQIPGMPGVFLVCEHETGKVWLLDKQNGKESKELFGDFRSEVRPGGATGLLGLAFHPRFRENRNYYIQHEREEAGQIYAIVSEKLAAPDFRHDSGQPSREIIRFRCSTDVHSGGGIAFGPDGFLYIGMGDTGPQGDPQGHGQDLKLPLGKMLRIDVDQADPGKSYGIPKDNPFVGKKDVRPEIWAYGFREPWRFSFDAVTGDLWVGDVGQDRIEEVDLVRRGENYGWNVYEGFELFSNRYRRQGETFVPPVFAYNRRYGNSITGGYVYRGKQSPSFYGVYVCADYTSKRIWGIVQKDRVMQMIRQIATCPQTVSSFGIDESGELYAVGYDGGTIYHLDLSHCTFNTEARP